MQKAIDHLEEELLNVRAGKASPQRPERRDGRLFRLAGSCFGRCQRHRTDARTILIQPWDKNMLRPIEKAIIDSNIGLTPSNNGEQIRLTIPLLTEERRKELVKQVRAEAETARISLRNARRDAGGSLQEGPEGGHARGRIEGRRNAVAETARKVLQDAGRSAFEEGEGDYDGLTCRLPQDEKPGWKFIPAGLFPSVCPANPAHTGAATPHRPGKTDSDRRRRIASDRKPVRHIRRPSAGPCLFHNIKNPGLQLRKPGFIYLQRLKPQRITYLRACGYEFLALLVARELHEVLHETVGQILCLNPPNPWRSCRCHADRG